MNQKHRRSTSTSVLLPYFESLKKLKEVLLVLVLVNSKFHSFFFLNLTDQSQ